MIKSLSVVLSLVLSLSGMAGVLFLTGCASSAYKARQEQREKVASSAGLYCEWINGDKHSDIDVELNLQMGKRCDSVKPFTLTPYKNTSDENGIVYCCALTGAEPKAPSSSGIKKASGPAAQKAATATPAADEVVEDK
ncbi:MAG TPA: hypothetical protein VIG33_05195 [Pseudobdellovibrionaceae bacterium]